MLHAPFSVKHIIHPTHVPVAVLLKNSESPAHPAPYVPDVLKDSRTLQAAIKMGAVLQLQLCAGGQTPLQKVDILPADAALTN